MRKSHFMKIGTVNIIFYKIGTIVKIETILFKKNPLLAVWANVKLSPENKRAP